MMNFFNSNSLHFSSDAAQTSAASVEPTFEENTFGFVAGFIVPGLPQPLLAPEKSPAWGRVRAAFQTLKERLDELKPDVLVIYSTQWPSVLGHQIQADPRPQGVHVDHEFHELGTMEYNFPVHVPYADAYIAAGKDRGLHMRRVCFKGFPIDSGSLVALGLLNPENRIPCALVSSNMYADRAETIVLGKSARDAVQTKKLRAVAIASTALSHRLWTKPVAPKDDTISSQKDDEWNRKLLEILAQGRLEDVAQLARQFAREAHADSKLKALWWLSAALGSSNDFRGEVLAYEGLYGTGAAVVELRPGGVSRGEQEFDEDDVEFYRGERSVLTSSSMKTENPK
jgi:2-aminophenol/2-amino-5-chlorophenol 1,6-dioxygenase alpha subunit